MILHLVHDEPHFDHGGNHIPYYDVGLPAGAADIVRDSVDWSTAGNLLPQIQNEFPSVTAKQIQRSWTKMS